MSPIERLLGVVLLLATLAAGGWFALEHYGAEQYQAGHAAAVAAGERLRLAEAERNREAESDLREQLRARDADAYRKDQEYATNLDAAQRRVRAGTDGLRCPASAVQPAAPAVDRPAAGGAAVDGEGPPMVPDVSADLLGLVADHQRLVQRYGRVVERFEACRALNAK